MILYYTIEEQRQTSGTFKIRLSFVCVAKNIAFARRNSNPFVFSGKYLKNPANRMLNVVA